jgi:hypothetical protein
MPDIIALEAREVTKRYAGVVALDRARVARPPPSWPR